MWKTASWPRQSLCLPKNIGPGHMGVVREIQSLILNARRISSRQLARKSGRDRIKSTGSRDNWITNSAAARRVSTVVRASLKVNQFNVVQNKFPGIQVMAMLAVSTVKMMKLRVDAAFLSRCASVSTDGGWRLVLGTVAAVPDTSDCVVAVVSLAGTVGPFPVLLLR